MTVEPKKNKAKAAALRLLTVKDRSKQELKERLERNFEESDVEEALIYLEKLGYLNDLRYAGNHVEYRNRQRPSGNYLLRMELNRKGIKETYIEQVLNPPEIEYKLAFTLAQQRLGRLEKVEALARTRRLYGLLQRRGFPGFVARRVVGELLDRDPENEYN
ncbi:MAG: regulatory protein RecX [Bacillota bacterium]|nr:regulatory protein RecX [Bacillota bacterium]HHU60950.1 regulatory protein RecX [Natronincola sp.]